MKGWERKGGSSRARVSMDASSSTLFSPAAAAAPIMVGRLGRAQRRRRRRMIGGCRGYRAPRAQELETDGHLWGPRFVGHPDTGA